MPVVISLDMDDTMTLLKHTCPPHAESSSV